MENIVNDPYTFKGDSSIHLAPGYSITIKGEHSSLTINNEGEIEIAATAILSYKSNIHQSIGIVKECHLSDNGVKTCYLYCQSNKDNALQLITLFEEARKDFPEMDPSWFKVIKLRYPGFAKTEYSNSLCIMITLTHWDKDPLGWHVNELEAIDNKWRGNWPEGYQKVGCKHYFLEQEE